jgi:hypothetical protein
MNKLFWFLVGCIVFIVALATAKLTINSDLTPKTKLLLLSLIMIFEPIALLCCAHFGDKELNRKDDYKDTQGE